MADKVTIIQGENATFTIKLRDENGDPFDISAYDKYKVCLPTASGTPIEVTEVANPTTGSIVTLDGLAVLGKLTVQLKTLDTAELLEEERMDIDLTLDIAASSDPKKAKFKNVLTVLTSLC